VVNWYAAQRSYPGAPRFPQLTTIAMVESRIERAGLRGEVNALFWLTANRIPPAAEWE
jgi:hypothetical protein